MYVRCSAHCVTHILFSKLDHSTNIIFEIISSLLSNLISNDFHEQIGGGHKSGGSAGSSTKDLFQSLGWMLTYSSVPKYLLFSANHRIFAHRYPSFMENCLYFPCFDAARKPVSLSYNGCYPPLLTFISFQRSTL